MIREIYGEVRPKFWYGRNGALDSALIAHSLKNVVVIVYHITINNAAFVEFRYYSMIKDVRHVRSIDSQDRMSQLRLVC